jgi:hypothetical protein
VPDGVVIRLVAVTSGNEDPCGRIEEVCSTAASSAMTIGRPIERDAGGEDQFYASTQYCGRAHSIKGNRKRLAFANRQIFVLGFLQYVPCLFVSSERYGNPHIYGIACPCVANLNRDFTPARDGLCEGDRNASTVG